MCTKVPSSNIGLISKPLHRIHLIGSELSSRRLQGHLLILLLLVLLYVRHLHLVVFFLFSLITVPLQLHQLSSLHDLFATYLNIHLIESFALIKPLFVKFILCLREVSVLFAIRKIVLVVTHFNYYILNVLEQA